MLTRIDIDGGTNTRTSLRIQEQKAPARQVVCTGVSDPMSERAATNIAFLYGGVLSRAPLGGWSVPQRAWSS